ncbi:flavocytochrome c [Treponema ruminis]|uniref:Urocanate reductase n=1 Tax=Treponema ruminis TaxID=744515 RepID=A0A7W8G731_9SPIR|nr:flavocytochrome c [Treponema ruminis]MBB5224939.1 fumarate reductase flavoprotein subunit [Treponema ruminis]
MKLSKIFSLFLSILFLFVSCEKEQSSLRDGMFIGKGHGRNGTVEVSITVSGGKIIDAEIIKDIESPNIAEIAKKRIIEKFLRDGSTSMIDAVSGATITSNAILDALDEAIAISQGIKKTSIIYKDSECDIVIIGAGGAGLTAATEAASRGAKVLVLEKMPIVGGNSNFSTGGINACYTKEQERLGIKDSKEVFFNDTMRGGQYLNDPDLVRTLIDNSAAMVEWLQTPMIGADLSDVGAFGGATNKRIHRPKGGGAIGAHLIPLLQKAALKQGAEIRLNNKVIDILSNNGRACGVRVAYEGGEYTVHSKAVIVATGGFGANPEMIEFYQASLAGFATTNHKGATGDAFKMVEKFDAQLIQMEQIQIHPTVVKGTGIMITEALRGNGAILVNKAGRRFVNEMETRDIVSAAVLKNPERSAYLLFDQSVRDSLKAVETYANQNLLSEGANLVELSRAIAVDAVALEYTVDQYNKAVQAKKDPDFGRNPESMERTLSNPPFYAIEIEPAIHHTMGGLKINTRAQVLNKLGLPIPGLFAAGEVTGGVHGGQRLGGNAVADICIFGKIAADSAIEFVSK